jgi:hypothetical protein
VQQVTVCECMIYALWPQKYYTQSNLHVLILTLKDRNMAGQKRYHRLLSFAKVVPLNVSARRKITLNDLGPIELVASTVTVSLLEGDLLAW